MRDAIDNQEIERLELDSRKHFRRCHDCGAINRHLDSVAPEVCCKKCGSQDTRKMKNEPPLWIGIGSIREHRGLYVPDAIGKCPECGESLIADCMEHELESGRPVATGIELHCKTFLGDDIEDVRTLHKFRQSDWQDVRDRVVKWCDARVDYASR